MPKKPTWNGQWHPFAERFPMLSEQELRDMAASIAEAGQIDSCVMTPEGLGLDGRNRVAACRIIEVEPRWTVYEGDPYDLIAARNLRHRNMTTAQRAMAEAVRLVGQGKREGGRWKHGSIPETPSDMSNVRQSGWRQAIHRAGIILDYRPDLADSILAGEELDAAYQQARTEKDHREGVAAEERKRRERASALPNDLAALVDSGVRDLDDAEREAEARKVVTAIDAVRNGDGSPPPSFTDRIQDGTLTWTEAQTLAEEWKQEREASIGRLTDSYRAIADNYSPAIPDLVANPDHPYYQAALNGLDSSRQEKIRKIIEQLKEPE